MIEVTLPELDRWLVAWLRWSKLTPVVFPWWPRLIVRSPCALRRLARETSDIQ
jgi:hypothetical protein